MFFRKKSYTCSCKKTLDFGPLFWKTRDRLLVDWMVGFQVVTPGFLEWAYYKWGVTMGLYCNPTVIRDFRSVVAVFKYFWNVHLPKIICGKCFSPILTFLHIFFQMFVVKSTTFPSYIIPWAKSLGFFKGTPPWLHRRLVLLLLPTLLCYKSWWSWYDLGSLDFGAKFCFGKFWTKVRFPTVEKVIMFHKGGNSTGGFLYPLGREEKKVDPR